jgi:hypothetical protein
MKPITNVYFEYTWLNNFVEISFCKDDVVLGQDDLIAQVGFDFEDSTLNLTYTEISSLYILKKDKLLDILFIPDNDIYKSASELELELEVMSVLIGQVITKNLDNDVKMCYN